MVAWKDIQWREPRGHIPDDRAGMRAARSEEFPWDLKIPYLVDSQGQLMPPIEEARAFLKLASQIEHGLMVEYLYASYTCPRGAETIGQGISKIAQEEMGHLVSVLNLFALCGATDILLQDQAPSESDPFPFQLAPLSLQSIARFTVCESPQNIPTSDIDPDAYAALQALAEKDLGGLKVQQVGAVYTKLYWLFLASDNPAENPWEQFKPEDFLRKHPEEKGRHVADGDLSVSQRLTETKSSDWNRSNQNLKILDAVKRSEALEALKQIIVQGEGPTDEKASHFQRFLKFYKESGNLPKLVADANYAVNPTTNPARRPGLLIKNKLAARLSDLLDGYYSAILSGLVLSMQSRYSAKKRILTDYLKTDMLYVSGMAKILVDLDLDGPASKKAGPAFMFPSQPGQDSSASYKEANTLSLEAVAALEAMQLDFSLRMELQDWKIQVNKRVELANELSGI